MKPPLNVLVIDDSEADVLLIRRELERQGIEARCERVDTLDGLLGVLAREWDLVLLDYQVPDMDCAETLTLVRQRRPDSPVVLVSGTIGEERAVDLLRLGAWDLVLKDRLARLGDTVRRCLEVAAEGRARRLAEDSHRRYRKQLHAFVQYAPVAMALLDRDMNYLAASGRWVAEFGRGYKDLVGRNHYEVHPDLPEEWKLGYRAALDGALLRRDDDHWVQADGMERWLRWGAHPWSDEDGRVGGIILFAEDGTERKNAERRVRESDQAYRAAIETSADGFCAVDLQGRILEVNDAYCRRSGYSRGELLTMRISELEAVETPEAVAAKIEKFRRQGRAVFETRHRRKDGGQWPLEIRATFSDIGGGRFLAFLHDISERKRVERESRARRTDLEMLLQQQVAAQTAAAIAHELNQPLVSLSFYGEAALAMLDGVDGSEKLRRTLEASVAQAQRAGETLHELLAFLHQADTAVAPLDLNATVQEAIATVWHDRFAGFQTVLELEPHLRPVLGNRVQVQKVLVNLLTNSVEALRHSDLPANAISIRVATAAGSNMAQVTVQDSGPGLDAETLQRIFEPFFTTKPKGIGLGLAISRSLIESHGGQLWADADTGPGATFHFTLPFAP